MKKLIALFAVSTVASTSAIAGVALSGSASVSYDDNGSNASATTYDADLSVVGTNGATSVTASFDIDGASISTSAVDLATKIKIEPEVMINTDIEHKDDSYYVVKTWGRYKVINVDDVLEVPEFFRRKSEAIEFAKNMNSEHYATPALYTN